MYKNTFLSKIELENMLCGKASSLDINTILCAFEMSENAFENHLNIDGLPYFFHLSRVTKILISELGLIDKDLIVSTLLHDIYKISSQLSPEIIEYNFGGYVCFLIDTLSTPNALLNRLPKEFSDKESAFFRNVSDDILIIMLSEHLDNFRCMDFNIKYNPISYIKEVQERFFPAAEKSDNKMIKQLVDELKKERNKIIC